MDITKYKWDGISPINTRVDNDGDICIDAPDDYKFHILKTDAIAIAKHFNLFSMSDCELEYEASKSMNKLKNSQVVGVVGDE